MLDTPETYLSDDAYAALIDGLLNAPCACDPRSRVIELLGEKANVWPASARHEVDAPVQSETLSRGRGGVVERQAFVGTKLDSAR